MYYNIKLLICQMKNASMLLLDAEDVDGLIETPIILKSLRPIVSSNDDVTLPAGVFAVLLSKNIAPDRD